MVRIVRTALAVGLGLFIVGVLASPAEAAAGTLYVATSNCSDSGSGTSAQPFCTIIHAASVATAGQTVEVAAGMYTGPIVVKNSGTATSPLQFHPAAGATVTVQGGQYGFSLSGRAYVTVSGFTVTGTVGNGIKVSSGDHITLSGNAVTLSGKPVSGQIAAGIALSNTTNSTVTGNVTDNNSDTGIYLSSGTTGTTVSYNEASGNANGYQRNANGINVVSAGNSIIGNVLHDNEDSGLQFYPGGNNNLAALNVSYNNGDHGIDDLNVTGGRLIGNTIYRNCTSGINVEGTSGNYLVENNIAVDNAVYPAYKGISCNRRAGNIGIWDSAPSSTTVDDNLVWLTKSGPMYVFGYSYATLAAMHAATGQEAHGLQSDPNFVAAASGNLQLGATSAAIDSADSSVSGEQPADILGQARVDTPGVANTGIGVRSYDDRGAYEYAGVGVTNSPPVAKLSVSPGSGTAPVAVTADASGSSDPQGQALSFRFDFGDGTAVGPQSQATAGHTYAVAGSYSVTVTVTDSGGLSSTATASVSVSAVTNSPPVAKLSVSPGSGTAPVAVTADASGSSDPQGQALSFRFDFGDGTAVGPQSQATAGHTYAVAGSYSVTVTVTDSGGLSSTATASVSVSAVTNSPPVAKLSVSPGSGTAPVAVTADASGSSDPQGQALSFRFDFGDGTAVGPQSQATAGHTYAVAGSYSVTVTVTDSGGLSSTATASVSVSAVTNSPPVAKLSVSPGSGTAPVAVTADASGSSDPQGQALSFRFDFGDGTAVGPQSQATAGHTYAVAGSYSVTVTVTDSGGLSSTATASVSVSTATSGPASYVNQIATNYSTSVHTSGSITVWRTGGVAAGHLMVVTVTLTGTAPTGAVSGTDSTGDVLTVASDIADAAGHRLLVLYGTAPTGLAVNQTITVRFPSAVTYRIAGDEIANATGVDVHAQTAGTTAPFSSGATATTAGSGEFVFAAMAAYSGSAPTWASGWSALSSYAINADFLGRSYRISGAPSSYAGSGTVTGSWLAITVAFR